MGQEIDFGAMSLWKTIWGSVTHGLCYLYRSQPADWSTSPYDLSQEITKEVTYQVSDLVTTVDGPKLADWFVFKTQNDTYPFVMIHRSNLEMA